VNAHRILQYLSPEPGPTTLAIILASTSSIRKTILKNAGIEFAALDPELDENVAKRSLVAPGPEAMANALAEAKSKRVSERFPGALVIGADQTLGLEGQIFDKPRSIAEARQHLQALRNRTHELYSAICCTVDGKTVWTHCGKAQLTMRDFSDVFLDRYILSISKTYLSSVGGYKLEESGITLFEQIEGDYFTILGLPLLPLLKFLRQEKYIPS
jgi:septum formation protein